MHSLSDLAKELSRSVLYGSDAIGGTVNVLTKSGNFREEAAGASFIHGLVSYRFSTAENSRIGHAEFNLPDEEYRAHGSGSNEPGFGGMVGVTVRF